MPPRAAVTAWPAGFASCAGRGVAKLRSSLRRTWSSRCSPVTLTPIPRSEKTITCVCGPASFRSLSDRAVQRLIDLLDWIRRAAFEQMPALMADTMSIFENDQKQIPLRLLQQLAHRRGFLRYSIAEMIEKNFELAVLERVQPAKPLGVGAIRHVIAESGQQSGCKLRRPTARVEMVASVNVPVGDLDSVQPGGERSISERR